MFALGLNKPLTVRIKAQRVHSPAAFQSMFQQAPRRPSILQSYAQKCIWGVV